MMPEIENGMAVEAPQSTRRRQDIERAEAELREAGI